MSNQNGTELIRAILKAEQDAAEAEMRAGTLREKYAEEAKEFHRSEIVEVLQEHADPKWVRATVVNYAFRTTPFFGMVYTVRLHRGAPIGTEGSHVKASGANIRKCEV